MNSSKVLKYSIQFTKTCKINNIPAGRRFSTNSHLLHRYSRVAGAAGVGVLSLIAYGLTSNFNAHAYTKKKVRKTT